MFYTAKNRVKAHTFVIASKCHNIMLLDKICGARCKGAIICIILWCIKKKNTVFALPKLCTSMCTPFVSCNISVTDNAITLANISPYPACCSYDVTSFQRNEKDWRSPKLSDQSSESSLSLPIYVQDMQTTQTTISIVPVSSWRNCHKTFV